MPREYASTSKSDITFFRALYISPPSTDSCERVAAPQRLVVEQVIDLFEVGKVGLPPLVPKSPSAGANSFLAASSLT